MKRREFTVLLVGVLTASPFRTIAQQPERMRRIGMLMNLTAADPEAQTRIAAFMQGLQELGWVLGRNLRVDFRWGGDVQGYRQGAEELAATAPDLILASTDPALAAAQQVTRTLPIVFVNMIDPVGGGYVQSLSRPGGNTTGFTLYEYSTAGKLLELLKEIAPFTARAGVLRNPASPAAPGQFGAIQALAPSMGVALFPIDARDSTETERAVSEIARGPNGGLILLASGLGAHRDLFITLAARYRLPAVYPFAYYVNAGGLLCYGPDSVDQYRRAAIYVDRILKGEKPADLPVQAAVKYTLAINLKTAKALGLIIPPALLTRADEVLE
jgi:putative ABC transport system substrate-binding protein